MRRFLQWLLKGYLQSALIGENAELRNRIVAINCEMAAREEKFAEERRVFANEQANLQHMRHTENATLQRENTRLMQQNIEIRRAFQHKMRSDMKRDVKKKAATKPRKRKRSNG